MLLKELIRIIFRIPDVRGPERPQTTTEIALTAEIVRETKAAMTEAEREEYDTLEIPDDIKQFDYDGKWIERSSHVFLWVANRVPIPVWRSIKITLRIALIAVAIVEIYFLGQLANHYLLQ